jgi:hypothetical protein
MQSPLALLESKLATPHLATVWRPRTEKSVDLEMQPPWMRPGWLAEFGFVQTFCHKIVLRGAFHLVASITAFSRASLGRGAVDFVRTPRGPAPSRQPSRAARASTVAFRSIPDASRCLKLIAPTFRAWRANRIQVETALPHRTFCASHC